jgi:hypothetical protein
MKLYILFFIASCSAALGQIPALVTMPLAIESPDLRDGEHLVTVRWYNDAVNGSVYGTEGTSITIQNGHSSITLGNAAPLPIGLLQSGNAWISVQFDGASEPALRYQVLPSALAHTASFALVAASLDPRATGLVTSINETAGAIELAGGRGISIERSGQRFEVSRTAAEEKGMFPGNGTAWQFIVKVKDTSLLDSEIICSVESPHGLVLVSSSYDAASKAYVITTSAVLQPDETLRWHIGHR